MAGYDLTTDASPQQDVFQSPDQIPGMPKATPTAAPPAFYGDTGNESAAMRGHAPELQSLYQKYYGTSTPDASAFSANLWNPYGLSNIEAMMKNDPVSQAYLKSLTAQPAASQTQPQSGQTFSDPASQQWEQILNQRISQLQTPYQNPGFDTAVNQLNTYLQRLNGPAYTPEQMSLMQTQAIDPLEQQRSQTKQQIIQRMASHGIGPGSGILEKALEDADQQFNAAGDKTRAAFAASGIGQSNQNAQIAAQIAPLIAQLYQGQFNAQDQRANEAAQLAGVIPNAAWSRLMGANGTLQQNNPLQALQLLQSFQNQGYGQNADFASGLMSLIPLLFNL